LNNGALQTFLQIALIEWRFNPPIMISGAIYLCLWKVLLIILRDRKVEAIC